MIEPDELRKIHAIADEISGERARQINTEGYAVEDDDEYASGQLAMAASAYAWSGGTGKRLSALELWPWDGRWWKPKDSRSDLIRAAALLIAEIERQDRLKASEGSQDMDDGRDYSEPYEP